MLKQIILFESLNLLSNVNTSGLLLIDYKQKTHYKIHINSIKIKAKTPPPENNLFLNLQFSVGFAESSKRRFLRGVKGVGSLVPREHRVKFIIARS